MGKIRSLRLHAAQVHRSHIRRYKRLSEEINEEMHVKHMRLYAYFESSVYT